MPWTTEDLKRLVELESHQQGVDPRLALAVVSQESEWNPNAVGDNGRSIGLFQLQEAAAKDAGLHPRFRSDPADNIKAGVTYLKQKLTQSGGNVEQALSRYNRGTPDYRGIGDPNYVQNVLRYYPDYQPQAQQKPGIMARVSNALSPASAEASTPQAASRSRLEELEAELARRDAQQPSQATQPAPPTARSTPEQDAAYRASRGQQEPATAPQTAPAPTTQPGASQGPPEPSPDPSATPGMRFQALPSITQLEPTDRLQKTKLFESLKPALQEEFLRSEEPATGGLAMGGGPVAQSHPVTDPLALLAGGREQRPAAPAPSRAPADLDEALRRELAPAQEGMTGLLLGGAAGTVGRTVGQMAQRALPWLGRAAGILPVAGEAAGSYGGRQANVALGNEQPGAVGDVLSAAVPVATRAVGAIAPAIVKRLPGSAGAQHEMMAERLQALPAKMAPTTASQTLYGAVIQHGNPAIPVQNLRQTAQELLALNAQRGAATRNPRVVRLAQEIDDLAKQYNDNVPMDVLYDRMQGAGEILKQARRTGGRGEKDLSRIYAGFHGSLENAAQSGIPGAETLQQAIKASRQEHAVDRLGRIVGQGRGIEEQAGSGYTFVKGKKMLSEFDRLLADDPVFSGSFTKPELDEMRGLFQAATKLPALPSAGGAQFGSGRAAVRASIGSMIGGPAGAAIAVSGPEVIARAMMTGPGRAMLRAALEGKGGLTPQTLAVLNTALREQLPAEKP